MSAIKLDKTDLHIIRILQTNSKITNLQLSKKIGLSPAPTLERVRKLEKTGVIRSYHAHIDATLLGLNVQTFVLVSLDWKKGSAMDRFLDRIREIPEIVECHIITGEADCLLRVITSDLQAYEHLLTQTLSGLEEIERVKSLIALSNPINSVLLPLDYSGDKA
jgi:Lrp/AsnC family transcriptional regulator, leucine-responsive regulatory protein